MDTIGIGFSEGVIQFPPSYKMQNNTNEFYNGKKIRFPAWTDRILYKAKNSNSLIQVTYDCNTDVFGSDHRPVYS